MLLIASKNDRFFISSEGFEALFRELDSMGVKGERAAHKALREGGKVFLGLAKGGVNRSNRKSDKHLIDALAVSTVKLDDGGNKYVSVGTYLGRGRYRNKVYWGHIHSLNSNVGGSISHDIGDFSNWRNGTWG